MEESREFQLTARASRYLKTLASRDESLTGLLGRDGARVRGTSIRLCRAEAKQLREYLTTRVAQVGFDDSYSPNEEGQMLEELIDRFYIP